MKSKILKPKHGLFPRLFLLLIFFASKSKASDIQIGQKALFATSFVIIGTYVEEENALKHLQQARLYIKSAGYFFNHIKNSYYVFAYQSDDKHATLRKLHELRTNPYFRDAWYYKHQPDKSIATSTQHQIVKNERKTERQFNLILEKRSPAVDAKEPIPRQIESSLIADSRIHAIAPVNTAFVSQSTIDKLQIAKSGDIIILNNLLFHRNAAILQQSSESDLNKLLSIMLDNSKMKIRIHGHTNGDFRGEIIIMGKKNKNYFRANSKNNYLQGDAVMLSLERAKIISRYLKEKGVLPERIEIKGWGGEKTIYPLNSVKSNLNSRVEIEILEK